MARGSEAFDDIVNYNHCGFDGYIVPVFAIRSLFAQSFHGRFGGSVREKAEAGQLLKQMKEGVQKPIAAILIVNNFPILSVRLSRG